MDIFSGEVPHRATSLGMLSAEAPEPPRLAGAEARRWPSRLRREALALGGCKAPESSVSRLDAG